MRVRPFKLSLASHSGMLGLCAAVALTMSLTAANKPRPIKKLSLDPTAEKVDLFDGMESDALEATLIPKSSLEGNVFIQNKTKKPLTVKFPAAFAATQVLKQGFGGGRGGGGMGGGMGGMPGGGMGGGGGGQAMGGGMGGGGMGGGMMGGGGMGGGGMGGGMMGGGGGGFFSIPAERTVQFPVTSVCLNHGKAEPRPKMTYRIVKLEEYTTDPVLQELVTMVGTGEFDSNKQAAQAAIWAVTDKMSWENLADKEIEHLGQPNEPYFTPGDLAAGQQILAQAQRLAKTREDKKVETTPRAGRIPEKKRR